MSRPLLFFREGDVVADRLRTAEERAEPVETEGQTAVRGCAVLEGVHQEAETLLRLFRREALATRTILACSFESWIRIEPPPISVPLQTKS